MTIFEQASRLKLRFETPKGTLSPEDLWDLPLSSTTGRLNLNQIAVGLDRLLRDATPVSFVEPAVSADPTIQLRFDIVKHVIDVRVAENKAQADERIRAEKKQRIMGLLARKEDETLQNMSREELEGILSSL